METTTNSLVKNNENEDMKIWQDLSHEQQQQVTDIKSNIDISDSQAILQYGVQAQSNISSFSDTILTKIKSKDTDFVGEVLSDLMVNVKDMDVDDLGEKRGFFSKMFGNVTNKTRKFIAQYDNINVQIDTIINELDKARMQLLKDVTLLDGMYDKNIEYLRQLDVYILAGSLKLQEINEHTVPKLREDAEKSHNALSAQELKDMMSLANRFEKKLHDLKLSRMIAIQTIPQLRLIQNNDQLLIEKIQSSILNTIPLWKNQIIIAITLFKQEKALRLQGQVNQTTNDLLAKNSEMLKQNSIEVARESEKGIVELETLKKVNADLIETIEETLKIQAEGKAKRTEAEVEMRALEDGLKQKLMNAQQIS